MSAKASFTNPPTTIAVKITAKIITQFDFIINAPTLRLNYYCNICLNNNLIR